MTVITDWLDVTYSPIDTPECAVLDVLQDAGAERLYHDDRGSTWKLNEGVMKIQYGSAWTRFSASGAILAHLRLQGVFMDYLSALSESPHNVTRLDAAYDVLSDAPPIISRLRRQYPRECNLTRKALRTKSILTTRTDGQETGTWYVGHRSTSKVTARVYDKQHESFERRGEEIPPMTRYEITIKGQMGPSLRDAAEPERIFWHFASPTLLKRPEGVSDWFSGWGGGWTYQREEKPLGAILQARIESSSDLAAIVALAERGDCLDYAVKLVSRIMKQHADTQRLSRAS